MLNLDEQIRVVIAQLSAGADPKGVLQSFATTIRSSQGQCVTVERVHTCASCGEPDVRCPPCFARNLAQEKILPAALGKFAQWRTGREGT